MRLSQSHQETEMIVGLTALSLLAAHPVASAIGGSAAAGAVAGIARAIKRKFQALKVGNLPENKTTAQDVETMEDVDPCFLIGTALSDHMARLVTVGGSAGRKLARECGLNVRLAMGAPMRSKANLIIVTQRCDAWLRDNCPNLRAADRQPVVCKAIYWALTPTKDELEVVQLLNSQEVARREVIKNSNHLIPVLDARVVPGGFQRFFGLVRPSMQNF